MEDGAREKVQTKRRSIILAGQGTGIGEVIGDGLLATEGRDLRDRKGEKSKEEQLNGDFRVREKVP